jgi:hypothetical protein
MASGFILSLMNSATNAKPVEVLSKKEEGALRQFVSGDHTRSNLATLWMYASDGGTTHVATDGHTICVRRTGTHRDMIPADIRKKLDAVALDSGTDADVIPAWDVVLVAGNDEASRKGGRQYGFNVDYIARVGAVERAAAERAVDAYVPAPKTSAKDVRKERADIRTRTCAKWVVPSDTMIGWYWRLETKEALWEGVVMPRRV